MTGDAVRRAHELAWRPGRWMRADWWAALGLEGWRDAYRRHPGCRDALDRLIVARRGFPAAPLPAVLGESAREALALETRLHVLSTAMGLVALDCRDYLLLGEYRRALSPVLGTRGCDQLLALRPVWGAGPADLTPDGLVAGAGERGGAALSAALPAPVRPVLSILLPPSAAAVPAAERNWPLLQRLARWL
jgi:hypothetical protein